MKYFSACSGIGGFELGIQYIMPKAVCVGYSEIDKYADSIYRRHFSEHKNYGDITRINSAELPDFDFFAGGFPCQSFSIAGSGNGFDDARGTIFFDFARILRDKRPRHFLFENVKGLLSNKSGESFTTILRILTEIGYRVEVVLLNTKDFGLPQSRDRVFFIGHLGGECERKLLSLGYTGQETRSNQLIRVGHIGKSNSQGNRVYDSEGVACNLVGLGGGLGAKTGLYIVKNKPIQLNSSKESGGKQPFQQNRVYSVESVAPACQAQLPQGSYSILVGERIRRLTPIECERLQGFPDNWTEGISDTQRYKCTGNAVSVNVITYLINSLWGCLQ